MYMHTWHTCMHTYIILHTCTLHMHILQHAYGYVHINACMHVFSMMKLCYIHKIMAG